MLLTFHVPKLMSLKKPDIIIKNKKEKTCILIDVAIPADRNVMQNGAEKKLKYKSLCIEIQRVWNMKCIIIPMVNWSQRNSNKRFKEKFTSHTRKIFNSFATKDSYTSNITHNAESAAV
jgi:hypothetical protein